MFVMIRRTKDTLYWYVINFTTPLQETKSNKITVDLQAVCLKGRLFCGAIDLSSGISNLSGENGVRLLLNAI